MTIASDFSLAELHWAQDEVVAIARDLIRFDTSNFGKSVDTKSTRTSAEYVADKLRGVGLQPELMEITSKHWAVICRWQGIDRNQPGMIWHGHLDVVPAGDGWSVPPFEGRITDDGYLYGRGAIDMKGQVATLLATVSLWERSGKKPPRDIVLVFLPDEEAGGFYGAHVLVRQYRELFKNCDVVIGGEVGGFSFRPPALEQDIFTISVEERGMWWWKAIAAGKQGHGSLFYPREDHAGNRLIDFLAEVRRMIRPKPSLSPEAINAFSLLAEIGGEHFDPANPDEFIKGLGPMAKWILPSIRDTTNFNVFSGGHKVNMTPGQAIVDIDTRLLPGSQLPQQIKELAHEYRIELENVSDVELPWASPIDRPELTVMKDAVLHHYPTAVFAQTRTAAGTDAKPFHYVLGLPTYGFGPLPLPSTEPFPDLFHGPDERVPIASLQAGVKILSTFIAGVKSTSELVEPTDSILVSKFANEELVTSYRNSGLLPAGTTLRLM